MTTRRKPKGSLAQCGAIKRRESIEQPYEEAKSIKLETDLFLPVDPEKTRDILEDAIVSHYKESGISAEELEECFDRQRQKFLLRKT